MSRNARAACRVGVVVALTTAAVTLASCGLCSGRHRHGASVDAQGVVDHRGGTVEVTSTSSEVFGARVVVPPGALLEGDVTTITVRHASDVSHAPPTGAVPASLAVLLTKDRDPDFLLPASITIPVDAAAFLAGDIPYAAWWDATYGVWSPLAIHDADVAAGRIVVASAHLTEFAVFAVSGVVAGSFATDTGFLAAADGMFRPNAESYVQPGGSALAIAAYAAWYYEHDKGVGGNPLYFAYLEGDVASWQDDVTAAEIVSRAYYASFRAWTALWPQSAVTQDARETGLQAIAAMRLSGAPQLLLLRGTSTGGAPIATAVLLRAYDEVAGRFLVYDPNFPGEDVTLDWTEAGGFGAYSKAAAYGGTFASFAHDTISSALTPSRFEGTFDAAAAGWPAPVYHKVTIAAPVPDANGDVWITGLDPVVVSGTVSDGDRPARWVAYHVNGGPVGVVPLTAGNAFTFTIPAAELQSPTNRVCIVGTPDVYDAWEPFADCFDLRVRLVATSFFGNLGFEAGNLSSWAHETHMWGDTLPGTVVPPLGGIVNGVDPLLPTLPALYAGAYAARLNDAVGGSHITSLSQSAVVPNAPNPQLRFYWAAVLDDPSHPPEAQPFVDIRVTDDTSSTVLYHQYFFANDPAYSGWIPAAGNALAIPWQVVLVSFPGLQGHTVTLSVTVGDCGYSGHAGYAYVDGDE